MAERLLLELLLRAVEGLPESLVRNDLFALGDELAVFQFGRGDLQQLVVETQAEPTRPGLALYY